MSTETADIERMARDIFSTASPAHEWETAQISRRRYSIFMAEQLTAMGYKPSIVHECCVEAQASKPRVLTAKDDLAALPPGSVITAHWEDGSQPDFTAIHGDVPCSVSYEGYAILGGHYWDEMDGWGATLTLEHAGQTNG